MEGIGRGGRGAKLLEALRAQQRRPGSEEPEGSQQSTEVKSGFSRGRGVLFAEQHAAPSQEFTEAPSRDAPPVSGGRGHKLMALMAQQKSQTATPGPSLTAAGPAATGPSAAVAAAAAPPTPAVRPVGRGRAALYEALRSMPGTSRGIPSPASAPTPAPTPKVSQTAVPVESLTRKMEQVEIERKPPVVFMGEQGERIPATANYVRLAVQPDKGVFEYEVRFTPTLDSKIIRSKILNSHSESIGRCKTFDGVTLYLPMKLPEEVTTLTSNHPVDNSPVTTKIIFKRKKNLHECVHLYNVLFKRIMGILELARIGRDTFDPHAARVIPQHKLEVWPGYVTAVDEYEGGIQLCCDTSHRVLRTQTVLDVIAEISSRNPAAFKDHIMKTVIGASVLTRYNNKIYRVDDIAWDRSPNDSFDTTSGDTITYCYYYKKQYGLEIKDLRQPLLISKVKKKLQNQEKIEQLICLVPELCFMTGLTDEMRSDFKVMKDIATYTRVTPNQRQGSLKTFIERVMSNDRAKSLLEDWGLKLEPSTVELTARVVKNEDIIFGGNRKVPGSQQAEWSGALSRNLVISAIDLMSWVLLRTARDLRYGNDFIDTMQKVGPQMGIQIAQPSVVELRDDRTESYVRALRESIRPNVQIVVIICPTARDDRYSAIKRICCSEMPVASQVINSRTLSKREKLRNIVQKIALQINCKLGGTLWAVQVPLDNLMVVGIDSYHDTLRKGSSVAAIVSSLNKSVTRWYSQVSIQGPGQEWVDSLRACFISSLKKYHEVNHKFPDKIIVYRDGIGDGQLAVCRDYEVPQFINCFPNINPSYSPKLTFIVCQKRINTRIFAQKTGSLDNPPPGTVMDNTITRRDWVDFFLVSQNVRQGTVSPTHYVVIHDTSSMQADHIQRMTYKMCHLYYNWPGTVRVPAPCQYAHKLAHLIGQNVRKEHSDKLSDRLFFL